LRPPIVPRCGRTTGRRPAVATRCPESSAWRGWRGVAALAQAPRAQAEGIGDEIEGRANGGERGTSAARSASSARLMPLAPERLAASENEREIWGEIDCWGAADRPATWLKCDAAARSTLTVFNTPDRRDLTNQNSVMAINRGVAENRPGFARRQSLPQPSCFPRPDYRPLRPSRRVRNWQLFSQTDE